MLNDDAMKYRDQCGADLHDKLDPCVQAHNVVNDAQNDDDHRAEQNPLKLPVDIRKQKDAENKAQKDGKPAQTGDGLFVHAPFVLRNVHGAHRLSKHAHKRGGHEADEKGQRGGRQNQQNKRKINVQARSPLLYEAHFFADFFHCASCQL